MATEEMKVKVSADVAGAVSGIKQVNNELDKTSKTVTKSGKDFTGLSRVIQDLPFGFIAISNNLTQLLPAAGAAGLAFSVLVSAITFASTGLQNWTRGLTGSKDGIDANSEALINFSNDIDDAKQRMDDFTTALNQINKIGKLRLDIDFGKSLTTDLLDLQGISVGNRELITKLEETEKIIGEGAGKIRDEFIHQIAGTKYFEAWTNDVLDAKDLPEDLKSLFDRMTDAEKDHLKAQGDILKARNGQNIIYAQIEQQKIDIIEDKEKKAEEARKKALRNIKKHVEVIRQYTTEIQSSGLIEIPIILELAKFNPVKETDREKLTRLSLPKEIPLRVNVAPKAVVTTPPDLTELQKALEQTAEEIGAGFFTSIGDGIAAAITGGDIGSVFESLFSFIGGALQELGKQMIELAPLLALLKASIATLDPTGGLLAGIGLVALGGILKNLKPKGFAAGGLAFGPTLGLVGEGVGTSRSNPEVIAPLDKLKNFIGNTGGSQVFIPSLELSYNKLMIAFNRAGKYGGLTS